MNISLKTHAKFAEPQRIEVDLYKRLPLRVSPPCKVVCTFAVEANTDHYLLVLDVTGTFEITCQRCLGQFQHDYHQNSKLAVCTNDVIAEALMDRYECIVAQNDELDLIDVLTDDLHLYLPESHYNEQSCDHEVSQLIGSTRQE